MTGLTTAALIWLAAAVGMAVGYGDYALGTVTTLVALIIMTLLGLVHDVRRWHSNRRRNRGIKGIKLLDVED